MFSDVLPPLVWCVYRDGGEGEAAGCSVDKTTEDMMVVEHKDVWVKEEMVEDGEHLTTPEHVLYSEPEHSG